MFFAELENLYPALLKDKEYQVPGPGYEERRIGAILVINNQGSLRQVQVLEKQDTLELLVPWDGGATSAVKPRFLWGNLQYCLGLPSAEKNKPERIAECFNQFKQKHLEVQEDINTPAFNSFCQFLNTWDPDTIPEGIPGLDEFIENGKLYCVFQLQGDVGYLHDEPEIKSWWDKKGLSFWESFTWDEETSTFLEDKEGPVEGQCSITGRTGKITKIHPSVRRVSNGKGTGSSLLSFNKSSFRSYGNKQGYNAPILEQVSQRAHAVLNCLLKKKQHARSLESTTVVFWSTPLELSQEIPLLEGLGITAEKTKDKAQDEATRAAIQNFLSDVKRGKAVRKDTDLLETGQYCIAGLTGYGARSCVQFFYKDTCANIHDALADHLSCLEIELINNKGEKRELPTVKEILGLVTSNNYTPGRTTKLFHAILFKQRYPLDIYYQALHLLTLPRNKDHLPWWVEYTAVSYVKAVLTRNFGKELTMSLDTDCQDSGYLLGRLFSTFVKIQEESLGGSKEVRTVADTLLGSASQSPARIFDRLFQLNRHHLRKLNPGRQVSFEKKLAEIVGLLGTNLPATLDAQERGQFFLGYYQQRQDFFTKRVEDLGVAEQTVGAGIF